MQENGFDSLQAFLDARSEAQNACPREYAFTKDQLKLMSSLLSPENLRSSLEHGLQDLPRQFEKDNIDSLRASFLTIQVDSQSYTLDSEEHVQSFIEAIAVKSSASAAVKDLMLLVGTQTLLNCVMQGKNEPSLVRLHDVKSTQDQVTFKADLTFRFSSGLKLSANTDADAARLSSILKKLGYDSVFSAEIQAQFQGTVNTKTGSSSLALVKPPKVSITR